MRTWGVRSRWRLSASGKVALRVGKTMLSQWLQKQTSCARGRVDSRAASARSQSLPGAICAMLKGTVSVFRHAGSGVWRRDRHEPMHARLGVAGEPGAHCQTAHAVRGDHGSESGHALQRVRRRGNGVAVRIDRSEHRLEADRDERDLGCPQATQPWIPQPAVAEESVHEKHAAPTHRRSGQVVRLARRGERLLPKKDVRCAGDLLCPRADQLGGRRTRCVSSQIRTAKEPELDRHDAQVPEDHQRDPDQAEPGLVEVEASGEGGQGEDDQRQGDELLYAREHHRRPKEKASVAGTEAFTR